MQNIRVDGITAIVPYQTHDGKNKTCNRRKLRW